MQIKIPTEKLVTGNTVFFTFATKGYLGFTKNLHASLLRVTPYLADRLIVFCSDVGTQEELQDTKIHTINCNADNLPEFAVFKSQNFGRVIAYKYFIASQLLQSYEYIWWCDSDIVVEAPILRHIKVLMLKHNCDLLMQYEWPRHQFNTGFWIARKSAEVERMLEVMLTYLHQGAKSDQNYFNEYLLKHNDLHVSGLHYDEFMCGNRFYHKSFVKPKCFLMHFNYTLGKQLKEELMMGHGVWYTESSFISLFRARFKRIIRTAFKKLTGENSYHRQILQEEKAALEVVNFNSTER